MHLVALFVFIVALATPSEMKTMEEIEEALDFLKTELMKANNNTEERLSHLEEITKLNTIRTCDEMAQFGITASNFYFVDPDGPLIGSDPFRVWCDFTQEGFAITEILHDSEELMEVEHCPDAACYKHNIIYTAPHEQILSLIELSMECEQTVRYDCLLAPLFANDINLGLWVDRHNETNFYWQGSHRGQHVCSCFYEEEGCLEAGLKNTTCNCDADAPELVQDIGSITNKSALPVSELRYGGLVYDMQQAFHSLGRLRCWGKAEYQEGTSCAAIKRSGQYHSGFFNVRKNEDENTQLVFCNQTVTPGYEDGENEEFVESSEDHFNMVEEDIGTIKKVVSVNEEKISSLESDVDVNEGKISILEDDVTSLEMKSSFCGYRNDWYPVGANDKVITYDNLIVNDNNIDGASFDIATGQFTAGLSGLYKVDFYIGNMNKYNSNDNDLYLRINGNNIGESRLRQNFGSGTNEIGGRSMLVNMVRGDKLDAFGHHVNDLYYVTFCVSLVK